MWTILFTLSLLIVTQAANLDNLFSTTWTQVAFYPRSVYVPACIEFYFDKASHDADCTCSDEKKATLVAGGYFIKKTKLNSQERPTIAVDSPSEVKLDVNCTCGALQFTSRAAVREINDNYLVMYEKLPSSSAYVFAKQVPKEEDLYNFLIKIEDLKDKLGAMMCASDYNFN